MKNLVNKVPPDGGYGWVIAFAMAVNGFIYIPMMQCFGLIFKDTFAKLHMSAAQGSLIINLHASFGMLMGLLNGVVLKKLGYRKTAYLAAILYFSGITLTYFATSFHHFVVLYGIIASLGLGFSRSSYSLALNSYFKKRRSKALSFTVTFIGLGGIIIPQLASFLMKIYTTHGVILIFGGICAHFFATATLLQPIKYHMKLEEQSLPEKISDPDDDSQLSTVDTEICDSHLNLNETNGKKKFLTNIVTFFDLDLLKDPIFINILIGMALAVFSELNFTVLTPFILNDYGLTIDQIAIFMSTSGFADILFRLLAPYIGAYLKKPPRYMFVMTLIMLIIMRFVLLASSDFYIMLVSAIGLGIAKGIRRVYMGLIIPGHVSLERLPSASGMEMMTNGFCILTGGAILGIVRDMTGSYSACIVIMNCVTTIPILLWSLEHVILKNKRKKEVKTSEEEDHPLNKI